jgi:hypothetical protein
VVCLFADDCIFYRKNSLTKYDILKEFSDECIWSFSFRIGKNVSQHDYISGRPNKPPLEHWEYTDILVWNFRKGFSDMWESSFSFPFGFDGCCYRSSDLLFLANEKDFGGISQWEHFVCRNDRLNLLSSRQYMACPVQSTVFCQQINHTHNRGLTNKGYRRSLEELNQAYLDNHIVSLESMNFSDIRSTHQEIRFDLQRI